MGFHNQPRIRVKRVSRVLSLLSLSLLGSTWLVWTQASDRKNKNTVEQRTQQPKDRAVWNRARLSFELNVGQADGEAKFLARVPGGTVFLTPRGTTFAVRRSNLSWPPESAPYVRRGVRHEWGLSSLPAPATTLFRMELVGSAPTAELTGVASLPGKVNYLIGNDASKWRANVPTFTAVKQTNVYPGIDLVYHSTETQLEYDFVVHPRADPASIRLTLHDVDGVQLDSDGNLVIRLRDDKVTFVRPFIYQEIDGTRRPIEGNYVLMGGQQIAFRIGHYDRAHPVVIDPVLFYSTYFGGSGRDRGEGVAVDRDGNAYLVGSATSVDLPLAGPFQADNRGTWNAFVTKFSADGTTLAYSTYFGGDDVTWGQAIAVDGSGNALIGGTTSSLDLPIANAFQPNPGGGDCGCCRCSDAFLAKLSSDGSALLFSTYLGGPGDDYGRSVAVDGSENVSIAGIVCEPNFPTVRPLQSSLAGGCDAFVAKFDAAGTPLFSTYLGGSDYDAAQGVASDSTGNVYVTGTARSADFPVGQAIQPRYAGNDDAFVAKLSADGSSVIYSTYLGGSDLDIGLSIAVDREGNAYITGETGSPNFPVAHALQTFRPSRYSAFVTKLGPSGSTLEYSTYLSGNEASGIAVDSFGNAHVVGSYERSLPVRWQVFATVLNSTGQSLIFYFSPVTNGDDFGQAVAVDPAGNTYLTGSARSSNFPTVSALQPTRPGESSPVIAKLALATDPIDLLVDRFGADGIDYAFWSAEARHASVAEFGGTLNIRPAPNDGSSVGLLISKSVYSLFNSQASVKVVQVVGDGNVNNKFSLQQDWNNNLIWWYENGYLYGLYYLNGQRTIVATLQYSAFLHAWWRIRESKGVVYWDTSVNGTYWIEQGTAPTASLFPLDSLSAILDAASWGAGSPNPGMAQYANFNVAP